MKPLVVSAYIMIFMIGGVFFGTQADWDYVVATSPAVVRLIAHGVGWNPTPHHIKAPKS